MKDYTARFWSAKEGKMYYLTSEKTNTMGLIYYKYIGYPEGIEAVYPEYSSYFMNWTFLKDREGKKIFANDIIEWNGYRERVFEVKGSNRFEPFDSTKEAKDCIVLGNFWENPELLKGTHA